MGRNSGTSPLILSSGEKELCGPQVASGPHQGDSRGVVGWSRDGRGVPAELQPPRQDSLMVVVVVDRGPGDGLSCCGGGWLSTITLTWMVAL